MENQTNENLSTKQCLIIAAVVIGFMAAMFYGMGMDPMANAQNTAEAPDRGYAYLYYGSTGLLIYLLLLRLSLMLSWGRVRKIGQKIKV